MHNCVSCYITSQFKDFAIRAVAKILSEIFLSKGKRRASFKPNPLLNCTASILPFGIVIQVEMRHQPALGGQEIKFRGGYPGRNFP